MPGAHAHAQAGSEHLMTGVGVGVGVGVGAHPHHQQHTGLLSSASDMAVAMAASGSFDYLHQHMAGSAAGVCVSVSVSVSVCGGGVGVRMCVGGCVFVPFFCGRGGSLPIHCILFHVITQLLRGPICACASRSCGRAGALLWHARYLRVKLAAASPMGLHFKFLVPHQHPTLSYGPTWVLETLTDESVSPFPCVFHTQTRQPLPRITSTNSTLPNSLHT